MTRDSFRLFAYWGPRAESVGDCAERLARLINDLAAHDRRVFAGWIFKLAARPEAASTVCRVPPDLAQLTTVVEEGMHRGDVDGLPMPQIGFSVHGWNGQEGPFAAALEANMGAYTPLKAQPNRLGLTLAGPMPENAAILTADWLRPVFQALAVALEPEWITVYPFGTLGRIEARDGRVRWPYGGWMVYLKPDWAARVSAPAGCAVESLPDGGALLIAVQDGPFSFDNPAHTDAFEALRRSLAPLWPDLEGRISRPANQGGSDPAGARTGTA